MMADIRHMTHDGIYTRHIGSVQRCGQVRPSVSVGATTAFNLRLDGDHMRA